MQIAAVYDLMGDPHGSLEWFERLNMRVPQDPGVLARLGALHARCGELTTCPLDSSRPVTLGHIWGHVDCAHLCQFMMCAV